MHRSQLDGLIIDRKTDDLGREKLSTTRVEKISNWWVMEAPTGHRFCMVTADKNSIHENANSWE